MLCLSVAAKEWSPLFLYQASSLRWPQEMPPQEAGSWLGSKLCRACADLNSLQVCQIQMQLALSCSLQDKALLTKTSQGSEYNTLLPASIDIILPPAQLILSIAHLPLTHAETGPQAGIRPLHTSSANDALCKQMGEEYEHILLSDDPSYVPVASHCLRSFSLFSFSYVCAYSPIVLSTNSSISCISHLSHSLLLIPHSLNFRSQPSFSSLGSAITEAIIVVTFSSETVKSCLHPCGKSQGIYTAMVLWPLTWEIISI